jgi:fructokinase
LLAKAKLGVFDVNLRTPYYSPELIEELGAQAQIIKLNDAELALMSEWYGIKGSNDRDQMESVLKRFSLQGIVQTRGDKGAIYFNGQEFFEHPGFKVEVADTIGSGDAFLAGFLHGTLSGLSPQENLALGCGMGALTATFKGGTPVISLQALEVFVGLKSND